MINHNDLIKQVPQLDEQKVCELYALLLPRAMETNPLKEWRMTSFPRKEDLVEVMRTLPSKDCQVIADLYFPHPR